MSGQKVCLQEASLILKQMRQLGMKTHVLSTDVLASPAFVELGGEATNGVFVTVARTKDTKDPRSVAFALASPTRNWVTTRADTEEPGGYRVAGEARLSAAAWTARTMFWYPVHRHRLPARASRISPRWAGGVSSDSSGATGLSTAPWQSRLVNHWP